MPRTAPKIDDGLEVSGRARKIPNSQIARFKVFYVRTRDIAKSAQLCGLSIRDGNMLWRNRDVRASIQKQIALIENEQAKLDAQADRLQVNLLDAKLTTLITLDPKKHGRVVKDALELGYRRAGLIRDNEFVQTAHPAAKNVTGAPIMYQGVTTVARRTTTEELVHHSVIAHSHDDDDSSGSPSAAPLVIEAPKRDAPAPKTIEILEY